MVGLAGLLPNAWSLRRVEEVVEHTKLLNRFLVELMVRLVMERENLGVMMTTCSQLIVSCWWAEST